MSAERKDVFRVEFSHTEGKLPNWFWKGFATAERAAVGGDIPALVVKDGNRSLVIVDANDWNPLMSERDIDTQRGDP